LRFVVRPVINASLSMILLWVLLGLFGAWTLAAFVFTMGALTSVRRLLRRFAAQRGTVTAWPRVAILRPCAGAEPSLEENLLSTATARYDGAREIFLLVASREDAAYPVMEAAARRAAEVAPSVPVRVVVTGIDTLHNRKVAQLAHAERLSDAEVVAVIDSDVELDDETLPALVTALVADPRAGASSCGPIDIRRDALGDRASAAVLTSTPHAFYCLAGLAETSGGAHVLCGALIALHRRVLDELGGFASLERYIGEDFELARRLHAAGYTIPIAWAPGRVTDHGRTLGAVVKRFVRWATVTRTQRAHLLATYVIFLGCGPILLVSGAAMLALGDPHMAPFAIGAGVLLVQRTILAMMLRRAYGLSAAPHRAFFAMLLGELVIDIATFGALGPPIVAWRGNRYRIGKGGLIDLIT
jgi:ceramide glucosyltransferase